LRSADRPISSSPRGRESIAIFATISASAGSRYCKRLLTPRFADVLPRQRAAMCGCDRR
jgi:hypothetical protein